MEDMRIKNTIKAPVETLSEPIERELLKSREARVAEARTLNLLSNVFMSVALDDKAACQYVLRILLGNPELVVKEVRVQYRISKMTSHDGPIELTTVSIFVRLGKLRVYNIIIPSQSIA